MNAAHNNITTYKDSKGEPFIMHTYVHDQRIIPYDTFDLGDSEYTIMRIAPSVNGLIYLKILCIAGSNFAKRYTIPTTEFEKYTPEELQKALDHYEH